MSVRELIEMLSQMPQDAQVVLQEVEEDSCWFEEIARVDLEGDEVQLCHAPEWM